MRAIYTFYSYSVVHDDTGAWNILEETKDFVSRDAHRTSVKGIGNLKDFLLDEKVLTVGFRVDDPDYFGIICTESMRVPKSFARYEAKKSYVGESIDSLIVPQIVPYFFERVANVLNGDNIKGDRLNDFELVCKEPSGFLYIPSFVCCIHLLPGHLTPCIYLSLEYSIREHNFILIDVRDSTIVGVTEAAFAKLPLQMVKIGRGEVLITDIIPGFDYELALSNLLISEAEIKLSGQVQQGSIEYSCYNVAITNNDFAIVEMDVKGIAFGCNYITKAVSLEQTWESVGLDPRIVTSIPSKIQSRQQSYNSESGIDRELEKASKFRKSARRSFLKDSSVTKLHYTFSFLWFIVILFAFAIMLFNVLKTEHYKSTVSILIDGSEREYNDVSIAYNTRSLQNTLDGITASPSADSLRSAITEESIKLEASQIQWKAIVYQTVKDICKTNPLSISSRLSTTVLSLLYQT